MYNTPSAVFEIHCKVPGASDVPRGEVCVGHHTATRAQVKKYNQNIYSSRGL